MQNQATIAQYVPRIGKGEEILMAAPNTRKITPSLQGHAQEVVKCPSFLPPNPHGGRPQFQQKRDGDIE